MSTKDVSFRFKPRLDGGRRRQLPGYHPLEEFDVDVLPEELFKVEGFLPLRRRFRLRLSSQPLAVLKRSAFQASGRSDVPFKRKEKERDGIGPFLRETI